MSINSSRLYRFFQAFIKLSFVPESSPSSKSSTWTLLKLHFCTQQRRPERLLSASVGLGVCVCFYFFYASAVVYFLLSVSGLVYKQTSRGKQGKRQAGQR